MDEQKSMLSNHVLYATPDLLDREHVSLPQAAKTCCSENYHTALNSTERF